MDEETLIFLKPSALKRGLVGEILSRFERKGLEIVKLELINMSREKAERFYAVHKSKPFFENLLNVVGGERIVTAVLKGENAVRVVRKMIGTTDPAEAEAGTVRGDYGLDVTDNLIHASDSFESYLYEVKILFPKK
ncbi:MAG: nucleoside-diphosphate kinase [Nitrososphaeria archaeon]|nr:nucleoside-diphosphate kinase [Nitrososphaeria archaeon]NIN52100.1 nucleoside-diphosphate kinase [Nitrososphaeria archaeon]NIQ32562.1 nucleoside-diphosphate kinase [Nitrososphaeria archaeon]